MGLLLYDIESGAKHETKHSLEAKIAAFNAVLEFRKKHKNKDGIRKDIQNNWWYCPANWSPDYHKEGICPGGWNLEDHYNNSDNSNNNAYKTPSKLIEIKTVHSKTIELENEYEIFVDQEHSNWFLRKLGFKQKRLSILSLMRRNGL